MPRSHLLPIVHMYIYIYTHMHNVRYIQEPVEELGLDKKSGYLRVHFCISQGRWQAERLRVRALFAGQNALLGGRNALFADRVF